MAPHPVKEQKPRGWEEELQLMLTDPNQLALPQTTTPA